MQSNSNSKILVTGATGFVGRFLCKLLLNRGYNVSGALRSAKSPDLIVSGVEPVLVAPLGAETTYKHSLDNIETLIHLAARVHVMHETANEPLYEFRKTNTLGTINIARQAAAAGVKRFVFMSTIGVNGNHSDSKPYTENDAPNPHNPYSISKYEAELGLKIISAETGMEVVVIRAPLVYGPGNPGNFLSLLRFLSKGIPLPLASVNNKRSLIYVGNLVDALAVCAKHPAAAAKTYLVSDGEDVSTPELLRRTASALGVSARLFSAPLSLVRLAGALTGKRTTVNQLTGSLTVDSSIIRRELGWNPPYTLEQGLKETAEWFKGSLNDG